MEAHTGHKPTQGRRRHVFFCSFLECSKHSKAIKVCPQWCFINKGSLDIGDSKVRNACMREHELVSGWRERISEVAPSLEG